MNNTKYTKEEIEQIKHIIDIYLQMPADCREKYIFYGEGIVIGGQLREA